jgi:serine/threonine protein kinase
MPDSVTSAPSQANPLTSLLAACDELLRDQGTLPPLPELVGEDAEQVRDKLRLGLECLQLLHEHFSPDLTGEPTDLSSIVQIRPDGMLERLGRFTIQTKLGQGGFGTVYRAHDPQLGRDVAVKVPHWDRVTRTDIQARFRLEAQAAAARLDHPHLVKVYEAGACGPLCYLVTELYSPHTLADWLHAHPEPLACDEAARFLQTLAEAVQHAHSRGVLHRDLKPGNILLGKPGEHPSGAGMATDHAPKPEGGSRLAAFAPKVTDFGLAKLVEEGDGNPTRTGTILGSTNYMSPEQAAGRVKEIGVATDVYALGVMLYEMLTGQAPFVAPTPLETLALIRQAEPARPRQVRPEIPADLETICLKCLEKEPNRRYASAAALAEDLRRFLADEPIQARPVGSWERGVKWIRRHPWQAAFLLVLVASLTVMTWLWRVAVAEGERAAEERKRAEEFARMPVRAMNDFVEEIIGNPGLTDEHLIKDREKLLTKAIQYYEEYVKEALLRNWARFELASAHCRLGFFLIVQGRYAEAHQHLDQAEALTEQLLKEEPASVSYRNLLANIYTHRGLFPQNRIVAYRARERALALAESTGSTELRTLNLFSMAVLLTGREGNAGTPEEQRRALEHARQAWNLLREQSPGPGGRLVQRTMLLRTARLLAVLEYHPVRSRQVLETTLREARQFLREHPEEVGLWQEWGACVKELSHFLSLEGDWTHAHAVVLEAYQTLEEFARNRQGSWPDNHRLQFLSMQAYLTYQVAVTLTRMPRPEVKNMSRWIEETEQWFQNIDRWFELTRKMTEPLQGVHKEDPWWPFILAMCHMHLAELGRLRNMPRWHHYEQARAYLETALQLKPSVVWEAELARVCFWHARMLSGYQRVDEAAQLLEETIARMEKALELYPRQARTMLLPELTAELVQVRRLQLHAWATRSLLPWPGTAYRGKLLVLQTWQAQGKAWLWQELALSAAIK